MVYWRRRRDLPLRGMLTFNNDRLLEFEKKQKRFRAAALGIIITSLAKRGMVNATSMNWAGLFSGMTSGDKTFLGFLSIMGLAYLGKLYFDSVDKAMEHGYDATITSTKNGSIRFTRGNTEIEEVAEEETEKEADGTDADYNEETV